MTDEPRLCACGCGEPLDGAPTRLYLDDAHRMRHRRAQARQGQPEPEQPEREPEQPEHEEPERPPEVEPGRARAGLEAWLEDHSSGLPEMLVETARALADRVDDDPGNSPIWGRFQHGLDMLFDAYLAEDARASQEVEEALAQVRHAGDVEAYRAAKYRQAEAIGDEAGMRKWGGRLVPEACGHGDHEWHTWPTGRVACIHCYVIDVEASSPESLPPHLRD